MESYLLNRRDTPLVEDRNHAYDVTDMTRESELPALADRLRSEAGGDVSLVAGGPPCQGYSGIGHRRTFNLEKHDIPSNHLYGHMARVIQEVGPKAFLFENVRGLLNARWTKQGASGEIWRDVEQTFRSIQFRRGHKLLQYDVRSALVYARDYGVPQNRPRVLMVGVRSDIALPPRRSPVADGFLPAPNGTAPHLEDLLGDLVDPYWIPGGSTDTYPFDPKSETQEQFRTVNGTILGQGEPLSEHQYSAHSAAMLEKFAYMIAHDGEIPAALQTKKFAQRVFPRHWGLNGPTITATSLPDDYVHFEQPRTPTVREWARLQTFPDSYKFHGRRTTGGRRRAGDPSIGNWSRDVPKFTQIGNAVPVALARQVGTHLKELLALD